MERRPVPGRSLGAFVRPRVRRAPRDDVGVRDRHEQGTRGPQQHRFHDQDDRILLRGPGRELGRDRAHPRALPGFDRSRRRGRYPVQRPAVQVHGRAGQRSHVEPPSGLPEGRRDPRAGSLLRPRPFGRARLDDALRRLGRPRVDRERRPSRIAVALPFVGFEAGPSFVARLGDRRVRRPRLRRGRLRLRCAHLAARRDGNRGRERRLPVLRVAQGQVRLPREPLPPALDEHPCLLLGRWDGGRARRGGLLQSELLAHVERAPHDARRQGSRDGHGRSRAEGLRSRGGRLAPEYRGGHVGAGARRGAVDGHGIPAHARRAPLRETRRCRASGGGRRHAFDRAPLPLHGAGLARRADPHGVLPALYPPGFVAHAPRGGDARGRRDLDALPGFAHGRPHGPGGRKHAFGRLRGGPLDRMR